MFHILDSWLYNITCVLWKYLYSTSYMNVNSFSGRSFNFLHTGKIHFLFPWDYIQVTIRCTVNCFRLQHHRNYSRTSSKMGYVYLYRAILFLFPRREQCLWIVCYPSHCMFFINITLFIVVPSVNHLYSWLKTLYLYIYFRYNF